MSFVAAATPLAAGVLPQDLRLPVARLDEPVRPAYRADRVELRLNPPAATLARTAAAIRAVRPDARADRFELLGVPAIDRAARALGGMWFEPEFPGETFQGSDAAGPDFTSYYLAHLAAGTDLATALATLRSLSEVASAEPIALLRVDAVPNDSLWTNAWWLFNASGRHDVHAPEAWDVTTGDASVRVAVLDTGVLPYHPDLGGTVAGGFGNVWTNAAEAAGFAGVDDDGNGYVDDVHGWDFVALPTQENVSPGEDWRDEDPDPNDYAGHGTAVAGLVGALANNGIGIPGAVWNVRLMPLRVAWSEAAEPLGIVDMAFAARAIRYATRMGADIINCSFETDTTSGLHAAARAAADAGVLIVNAAGNGSPYHDLADRDDVLGVAMTDASDQVSPLSNRGDYVDVSAPGVLVQSTFVAHAGSDSLGYRQPDYRSGLTGTSFAAPITSGVAALVVAQARASAEPLRKRELMFRLRETADDIAAENPGLDGFGTGRVNALRALTETEASFAAGGVGALTGAPAMLLTQGGERRLACATTNRRLLFLGAVSGDTLGMVTLPAEPFAPPAAADLGGGLGAGVFVALRGGVLAGYDGFGAPLPGWPVSVAADGVDLAMGPALGDLDGDGRLEVVCAANAGLVYAWRADGTRVDPFPQSLDGSDVVGLAISDLDGQPGAEVIVSTAGRVHAVRADVATPSAPGWPRIVTAPTAPLVARLGERTSPCVIVGTGTSLRAYEATGATRWTRSLGATPAYAPTAADVDGDGYDEIVIPVAFPSAIAAVDSGGQALAARGFPLSVTGVLESEVVVRTLESAPGAHLYAVVDGRLRGYDGLAGVLAEYPKIGRGVFAPTVYPGAAAGSVRAVTGSAFDSLIYFYRTPASATPGAERGWYTVRGNFARTASRLYAPAAAALDDRPRRVTDVAVVSVGDTSVTLRWTATGEDGATGRPLSYDLRAAQEPLDDDAAFAAAPHARAVAATVDAGGVETFRFDGVAAGRTWWFALKARDAQSQLSLLSNTVQATTGPGGPLAGVAGPAIATLAQPSRVPVSLYWKRGGGAAAGTVRIHDMAGRLVRTLGVAAAESGVVQWNGRDEGGRLVPAGVYFARLTSGSVHAQTRVVLLP